jgi:hypothetical protein
LKFGKGYMDSGIGVGLGVGLEKRNRIRIRIKGLVGEKGEEGDLHEDYPGFY